MARIAATLTLLLGLCGAVAATGAEASAEGKDAFRELFDVGWQKTYKAREAADHQYERLKKLMPGDRRVDFAYLLVLLRQSRHAEAIKTVDSLLQENRDDLTALQLKVWLAALTKEYDTAISGMQHVAELLPPPASPPTDEQQTQDIVALLGRLCGYMSGPVKDAVDDSTLARCQARILQLLSDPRKEVFERQRRSVVGQFVGAAEEAEQNTAMAEAEATKRKDEKVEQLSQNAEEAAQRQAETESQFERVKADLDAELTRISASERNLMARFQQVEAEAARVRNEIRAIDDRIANLVALANQEKKDDWQRQRWLNEAARWRLERDRWASSLAGLDRQYAGLNAERLGLQQQRANVQGRYQRETARVDQARKTTTTARGAVNRAQNATVTGNTPGVRDQKRRAAAMTSYVPLPIALDDARDKLLDSL